jgi:CHAT domain-containing protein
LREVESVRFSLHRLARRHGSTASLTAAERGLEYSAATLDAMLLEPVRDLVGDRELVIVPTGHLHARPWPVLPSLRGRPLSVAPSATSWLAANLTSHKTHRRAVTARSPVLVAGPQLDHALPEVKALAKLYAAPQLLTGKKASVDAVRSALDGAELVHMAAHGRFRADNPQFSATTSPTDR